MYGHMSNIFFVSSAIAYISRITAFLSCATVNVKKV